MNQTSTKSLSPFGLSAVALDSDFLELDRLSAQLERLSVDSESGLEQAKKILVRFSECGQRIGTGIQALAKELDESRGRAEAAANLVAARAAEIQERQKTADEMLGRFQALAEMVKKVSTAVGQLQKPAKEQLSAEEKEMLLKHLPDLNQQLGVLIDETVKLKNDAGHANLRTLEKNADSLGQSLQSVQSKLKNLSTQRPSSAELH